MAIRGVESRFGAIVPCLVVADVDEAIRFYREAFGAEELYRSPCEGGVGLHVDLRIWDSLVCLSREEPEVREKRAEYSMLGSPSTLGGTTCIFQVRVQDADEVFERAVDSGAAPASPPIDMFWGDRYSLVQDPFGYMWAIVAVNEILEPATIAERLNLSGERK